MQRTIVGITSFALSIRPVISCPPTTKFAVCQSYRNVPAVSGQRNTPPTVHGPGNRLGCPCRGTGTYLPAKSEHAHYTSMWHAIVAHRVTSHSGWRRRQAAPVTKLTGGPPVLRHIVHPVQDMKTVQRTSTPPPTHTVYAVYSYVLRFHNPPDPSQLEMQ